MASVSKPASWQSSSNVFMACFGILNFVVGVFTLDVQRRDAPRIHHVLINADVVLVARQHFAHDRHRRTPRRHTRHGLFQFRPERRNVLRVRSPADTEIEGVAADEIFSLPFFKLTKRGMYPPPPISPRGRLPIGASGTTASTPCVMYV